MSDNVNHPKHYEVLESVEVIDIIKSVLNDGFPSYCYGNIIKYILRAPKKNGFEDMKKAKVYLDWFIEHCENENI